MFRNLRNEIDRLVERPVAMISFIVPAHNEELLIGATLVAIRAAAREAGSD